jgi:peptidoglycan-associated lipoprotein
MRPLAATTGLCALVLSCAAGTQSPPRAPTPRPEPVARPAISSPTRSVVSISEDIRRACGVNDAEAHFAFDSARLSSSDYPILDKLVRCFSTGPLARRQMRLVGHADPRGGEEYNLVLGGSRADGVMGFLLDRGLSPGQVAASSRGEMDAKGTDEGSWAEDRRVDILLAN